MGAALPIVLRGGTRLEKAVIKVKKGGGPFGGALRAFARWVRRGNVPVIWPFRRLLSGERLVGLTAFCQEHSDIV
jgi:hypothetical protein